MATQRFHNILYLFTIYFSDYDPRHRVYISRKNINLRPFNIQLPNITVHAMQHITNRFYIYINILLAKNLRENRQHFLVYCMALIVSLRNIETRTPSTSTKRTINQCHFRHFISTKSLCKRRLWFNTKNLTRTETHCFPCRKSDICTSVKNSITASNETGK